MCIRRDRQPSCTATSRLPCCCSSQFSALPLRIHPPRMYPYPCRGGTRRTGPTPTRKSCPTLMPHPAQSFALYHAVGAAFLSGMSAPFPPGVTRPPVTSAPSIGGTCTCMHVYMHVYVYARVCTCTVYVCTCVRVHVCTCACTCARVQPLQVQLKARASRPGGSHGLMPQSRPHAAVTASCRSHGLMPQP